mmetsp:Transcript_13570/g.22338  ORF Transcript_13570/g.22338 Transcript_13570/m.22338 type:complete len:220 (-) Transcript_13570:1344-2003(-)
MQLPCCSPHDDRPHVQSSSPNTISPSMHMHPTHSSHTQDTKSHLHMHGLVPAPVLPEAAIFSHTGCCGARPPPENPPRTHKIHKCEPQMNNSLGSTHHSAGPMNNSRLSTLPAMDQTMPQKKKSRLLQSSAENLSCSQGLISQELSPLQQRPYFWTQQNHTRTAHMTKHSPYGDCLGEGSNSQSSHYLQTKAASLDQKIQIRTRTNTKAASDHCSTRMH